ncbi:MAG: UDP-glucose 4-epimerase GalE [Patescibacteria group bacterium]|mgnify:CR=1 FL=1
MQKILVTGGAGYIGSFMVRELRKKGFEPVIIEDMSSGHDEAVKDFELHKINLVDDKEKLDQLFSENSFLGVIHMAGFIQMGESYKNPIKYFENNLRCAQNVLGAMEKYKVPYFIFSSSAGVYGNPINTPIKEDDPKNPENPYGETKLMIEKMLSWCHKAGIIKFMSIRYFNAAGAALDGSVGEDHLDESHLIPNVIKKAIRAEEIEIFGDDYDTHDGTNIRDYIHVLDLVETHSLALEKLIGGAKSDFYNAGIGKGYSNKEVVEMIKNVTGILPKIKYGSRREGDANELVASIDKIKKDFNWSPKYGLKEIIESAYLWHKTHPSGYNVK